jgi:nitroreductase
LSSIHKLRSAQAPNKWSGLLQVLKSLATAAAAGALLVASHAFGLGWQWAGATIGALALAGVL